MNKKKNSPQRSQTETGTARTSLGFLPPLNDLSPVSPDQLPKSKMVGQVFINSFKVQCCHLLSWSLAWKHLMLLQIQFDFEESPKSKHETRLHNKEIYIKQ